MIYLFMNYCINVFLKWQKGNWLWDINFYLLIFNIKNEMVKYFFFINFFNYKLFFGKINILKI